MNLIGITGKSGSGKSYFATELGKTIGNSSVINIDNIFSEVMNDKAIVSRIYAIYGDKVIKNGKVDLDTVLVNKEIFNTIYKMVIEKIEECVRQEIIRSESERERKCNIGLVGTT